MNYIYKNWIYPIINGVTFRRHVDASTRPRPCLRVDSVNPHQDLACWCGCHPEEVDEVHRLNSNKTLIRLFHIFDVDSTGKLTATQVRNLLRFLGYNPSEVQVAVLMSHVDVDENEKLDIREFIHFMKSFISHNDSQTELKEIFRVLDPSGKGRVSASKLKYYFPTDTVILGENTELTFDEFCRLLTQE